jgi:WD40 repeat protein
MSHTATLLPNGKVLIAAGINSGNDPEASAELYDPATGKWTATGSLATGRFFHTATLLLNGKVLVAGGGSPGTSAELFDPASGTWAATGNLTTPRVRHTATLLSSGKVLVTGGSDGPTNTAELYDPATGKWTATGSLAIGRYFHTATLLPDGNVLVAGGNGADTSAELYDVAKGTWPATGTLNRTHTQHTATLLSNGSVLIAGSGDGDLADTKSAELYSTGQPIPSQLLNIATRLRVQTGENVLIGGFIITGTEPKKAIIRGIGPSLSSFFSGVLANPTLELHQGNTLLAVNDDWTEKRTEIEATGLQPSNNLESTIVRTLAPGNYTAIVRGKNGTTGIGVVEAYDLNQAAKSKLANLATRGFVETGDNVMIGGLIVGPQGAANTKVVVRAIGPSLSKFGINGALQNPTLDLVNSSGAVIRSNDNWKLTQRTEIEALNLQPSDDRESALVQTLAPGNYTAIVRGAGNTTGVGLVEVYNVE